MKAAKRSCASRSVRIRKPTTGETSSKRLRTDDKQSKSKDAHADGKTDTAEQAGAQDQGAVKKERDTDAKDHAAARGGARVDIFYIRPWSGWTETEPCKLCGTDDKLQHTFEASWKLWPDGETQYCSSMCFKHALQLVEREPDWKYATMTERNKQVYSAFGLLRREDWTESMRVCNAMVLGE